VPDARDLPPESIRFFALDPSWITALHEGVLSVGERSSVDANARKALRVPAWNRRMALVRDRRRGRASGAALARERASAPAPSSVSGFLLRSTLVSDYPGMQVRAVATLTPDAPSMRLLRLDRPAPGVLLALFEGTLAAVVLEEPHHGIRVGVDTSPNGNVLQLRRADGRLAGGASVAVPMRAGAASGVIDIAALAQRIAQSGTPDVLTAISSSALALQLLQPPVRQRFRRTP
jgi:hypothetical protein